MQNAIRANRAAFRAKLYTQAAESGSFQIVALFAFAQFEFIKDLLCGLGRVGRIKNRPAHHDRNLRRQEWPREESLRVSDQTEQRLSV